MDKKTITPNAYMLLALLISKGLISVEVKGVDKIEATKKKTKEQKIADRLKTVVEVNAGTAPETKDELNAVLTNIDDRYPELKEFKDDSQEAKNLTAIALINAPKVVSASTTTPVQMPQNIVAGMQNEIFERRDREDLYKTQAVNDKKQIAKFQTGAERFTKKKNKEVEEIRTTRYEMEAERDEQKLLADAQKLLAETANDKLIKKRRKIDEQKRSIDNLNEQLRSSLKSNNNKLTLDLRKLLKTKITDYKKSETEYTKITQALGQMGADVREIGQDVKTVLLTQTELKQAIGELKLPTTNRQEQRRVIIPPEYKRGQTGLGLTAKQRKDLRAIITTETNADYANVVDMIAGAEISPTTPANIMSALTGLALSVALPIPAPVMTNLLNIASREVGFDTWFNNMFQEHNTNIGANIVLTQKDATLQQIEKARPTPTVNNEVRGLENGPLEVSGPFEAKVQDAPPAIGAPSLDLKQDKKQQLKDSRGRFTSSRKVPAIGAVLTDNNGRLGMTQAGAVIGGLATYAITGSVASAVTGATAGGLIGSLSPAISRIGEALTERMPDTIPTMTGVQRAVQRQVTTGTRSVNIPSPSVSTREQETARLYNSIDTLNTEYNGLISRQRTINSLMVSNAEAGQSNRQFTTEARQIINDITQNRKSERELQDQLDAGPRRRVNIDRKDIEIPTLRATTDEEKSMVPFNEAEERTTYDKEKALAIAGAVGAGAVSIEAEKLKGYFYPESNERKIDIPSEVYTMQQKDVARGMLRPKFIIPSADIFQPSNQELAADALEFAMFDFVEPGSEGAEGNNQTNILKAFQQANENIRYRGAGVVVNSLFGNDANDITTEQINKMFLGAELPPLRFTEIQQNLSEYEVNSFDVNNERTGIEFFSPYNNFTDVNPGLSDNMSMLFDVVP